MNQRIANWFDKGEIVEALEGNDQYFIPDHTYRDEHDLLLIIITLIQWAEKRNRKELAAGKLFEVFTNAIGQHNLSKSLSLIHAYMLVVQDLNKELPINQKEVQAMLKSLIND